MGVQNRGDRDSAIQERYVKRVIKHPSYDPFTMMADQALIEVKKPFQLDSRVNLACLPQPGEKVAVGTQSCYIAGEVVFIYLKLQLIKLVSHTLNFIH